MTTTYTGSTPYDAEIEAYHLAFRATAPKKQVEDDRYHIHILIAKAEGYRRAKAEDAPLLAAAKKMLAAIQRLRVCPLCKEQECDCWEAAAQAIAQDEGRDQPASPHP